MTHTLAPLALVVSLGLAATSAVRFDGTEPDEVRNYKVETLPSLGGTSSRGNGINNWGLVAGFSNLTDNKARRATIWLDGRAHPLDTLGGTNSSVAWSGQSNRPLVVGIAQTPDPQTRKDGWSCRNFFPAPDNMKYLCLGFVWEWGQMTRLPTLGGDNGFAASRESTDGRLSAGRRTRCWIRTCAGEPQVYAVPRGALGSESTEPGARARFRSPASTRRRGHRDQQPRPGGRHFRRLRSIRRAALGKTRRDVGRQRRPCKDLGNVGGNTWNTPTAINQRGDIVVGFASSSRRRP